MVFLFSDKYGLKVVAYYVFLMSNVCCVKNVMP